MSTTRLPARVAVTAAVVLLVPVLAGCEPGQRLGATEQTYGSDRGATAVVSPDGPGASDRDADRGEGNVIMRTSVPGPTPTVATWTPGEQSTPARSTAFTATHPASPDPTRSTSTGTPTSSPTGKPTPSVPTPSTPTPSTTVPTRALEPGQRGPDVVALQRRLLDLGYWVSGTNGTYGHTTRQAVMALQKAAGLDRDGVAGPKTMQALHDGVRPSARSSQGHVIEIDKQRQLVKIVDGGRVSHIFNTSTGSGQPYRSATDGQTHIARTPSGSFRVTREVRGWRDAPLGRLYNAKYFNGGIALHGSNSIPGYPASHGCARVSVPAMDHLWSAGLVPIGTRVLVY